MEQLAFIGLGAMGEGIAANLLQGGCPVNIVVHRNPAPVERLVKMGARRFENRCAAASASGVICMCLPNSDTVSATVDELWPALRARHLVVDLGTSSVASSRRLEKRLASLGVAFAEAPLAGGKAQAEAGELGAFVGCRDDVLARTEDILNHFCTSVQHFGPVGSGSSAKLVSNYLVLNMVRLIVETFHSADMLGIDWQKFYQIISRGSSNSVALERTVGSIVEHGDFGGYVFSVENAKKDLRYIEELSQDEGLAALGSSALNLFDEADRMGFGAHRVSELLRSEVRMRLTELMGARASRPDK